MHECKLLDTVALEEFISNQGEWKTQYTSIITRYNSIVSELMKDWKGYGAETFEADSKKVISNLRNIGDILSTMCDTLSDCYDIFSECDLQLGKLNRDTIGK